MSNKLKYLRLFLDCKMVFKQKGTSVFWKVFWKPEKNMIKVEVPTVSTPIYLRPNTSDIDVFRQVFLQNDYALSKKMNLSGINFIVDCGANNGLSALYFSERFPNAKVVAVELESGNFAMLKKNVAGHANIFPLHAGVWEEDIMLEIPNLNGSNWEFMAAKSTDASADGPQTQKVQGLTLPTIMQRYQIPVIDILKIDVEGAEFEIFSNNPDKFLSKTRILIIELHDWIKEGVSKIFFDALRKYQYRLFCSGENIVCEITGK